jgi:GMP synthase-like glutamine amidotransferase
LDEGIPLPRPNGFGAVVAMGGPMSVNDESSLPWLADEKRFIGEWVRAGRPYWGVCLGAQLLAAGLGAPVHQAEAEVGVLPVRIEPGGRADPVFSALPPVVATLQWHSETFDLPDGSELLASSSAVRNQAFRWRRAYGLQFHLEAPTELVRRWGGIPAYARSLEEVMGRDGRRRLLDAMSEEAPAMRANALAIFQRWLDHVVMPYSRDRGDR